MKKAKVTIDVDIVDEAKLHETAKRIYVEVNEGRDPAEVEDEFDAQYGSVDAMDVGECLRLVFDRGDVLEGLSINDSFASIEGDGEDARPAGYTVEHSVWDSTSGRTGLSWMTFDPEGNRFEDDYESEDAAWQAARHHARTGEQLPA